MKHALRLAEDWAVLALGSVPVVALGFAEGGFFPRPWGWAALGLSCGAIVIVLARGVRVSPQSLVLLGLLGALGLWMGASLTWTRSVSLSVPELQRLLVYMTGVGAAALLVRARSARALVVGVFLGTSTVVVWGVLSYLVTRERALDVFQGAYLHRPLGYANAMAITTVLALLLGLGIVADSPRRLVRIGAAVVLVPLASALVLTGSRAAWIALLVGIAIAVSLTRERASVIRAWAWALVTPVLAVIAVSAANLPRSGLVADRADRLGELVLVVIVALTALAAVPALLARRRRQLRSAPGPFRGWLLAAVTAAGAVVLLGAARVTGAMGDRVLLWEVAFDEFRERPLLGSGAGTFAQTWLERRPTSSSARDAHSLPLEVLSELGVVGLVLVTLLLVLPLAWGFRARGTPLAPAATAAFGAYAVHASVDWDWELPAVTLAALFCAVALGVAADGERRMLAGGRWARAATLGALVLAAGIASTGHVGATAIEEASRALARGDITAADKAARRAERWQPWSVEPLLLRGRASFSVGDREGARLLFARAAARDPNDYRAWLALAGVSQGEAVDVALLRARELNARSLRGS